MGYYNNHNHPHQQQQSNASLSPTFLFFIFQVSFSVLSSSWMRLCPYYMLSSPPPQMVPLLAPNTLAYGCLFGLSSVLSIWIKAPVLIIPVHLG